MQVEVEIFECDESNYRPGYYLFVCPPGIFLEDIETGPAVFYDSKDWPDVDQGQGDRSIPLEGLTLFVVFMSGDEGQRAKQDLELWLAGVGHSCSFAPGIRPGFAA